MRLLSALRHENLVTLLDVIPPPPGGGSTASGGTPRQLSDVYLVYCLMDSDLHQIIRSPQPLSEEHVKYFVYQVKCVCVWGVCGGGVCGC